jgi:photosystem II stability/assembly factor-like uncharacterized protein
MYKTTNGGLNWSPIPDTGFTDMYFSDSLTGWKIKSYIEKTTDGGLSWVRQTLPYGGNIITPYAFKISGINKDTLWANGGEVLWNNGTQTRDILYRTTNGGQNWLFQIPDTSMPYLNITLLKFISKLNGWAYGSNGRGLHTINGGDSIFYTDIKRIRKNVQLNFKLFQNYPNPFNLATNLRFEISELRFIKIKIYDLLGKEISLILNKNLSPGKYEIQWDGTNFSSGIYFYCMYADDYLIATKKIILLK